MKTRGHLTNKYCHSITGRLTSILLFSFLATSCTLMQLKKDNISFTDFYLAGTDFAANDYFFFYGLSAGEYELIINATGYEPYSKTCMVRPGYYENEMTIELVGKTDGL